jgi:hypothetical protein
MSSPTTKAVALTGSDQAVRAATADYRGFAVRETAGSTAVIRIYDDPDSANGTLLDTIALTANESMAAYYSPGIAATTGIYVDIVSGTVEGSIRVGD